MNILLTSLMVPGSPSGVRVHYERLARQLEQQGHCVTIITQDSLRPSVRRAIGVVRRGLALVLGSLGNRIGTELGYIAEIYFAIDTRAPYDVVNAQDVSSGWAARLALRDRVPVVVTGHFNDHPAEELVHQLELRGLTARFVHRWYNYLLRHTKHFIGVSEYVRRRIRPWLPADVHSAVVYNGVAMTAPPATVAEPVPDLRELYPGRTVLLNVGQLEERKNQRELVRVAAGLREYYPNFVLVLVGQGEDESLLRQMIAEAGLEHEVVLLGYQRNVMGVLSTADLYVHAATRENCPLVLIEAMAAECPAAALAVGGIPELLAAMPEALLPATAPTAELVQQLLHLLTTPGLLVQIRQQQRAAGLAHFDASVMLSHTLDFFKEAQQIAASNKRIDLDCPTPATQPVSEAQHV